jgi:hypothetical protein
MEHNEYKAAEQEAREQWQPTTSFKENSQPLLLDNMWEFWQKGAIGYKEFRNWLAQEYPSFASIRDSSVDDRIDELARLRSNRFNPEPEEESPDLSAPPPSR